MGDSMSLVLPGATSGSVTIDVPAVAGTNALTLPASTGTLALTSQLPVAGPTFSAYQTATQTVSTATSTKILYDTIEWNVNSCYSTSTSRFTPTVAGYYQLTASVESQNIGTGIHNLNFYKNGSNIKGGWSIAASSIYSGQNTCLVYANGTTDYFEMYWYHSYGSNRSTVNGIAGTYFQGSMVRAA
jgi:hypothetical protein